MLVEYYGPSTQYTRTKSERVDVQSLDELFHDWERKYPGFLEYVRTSCGVTVNLEYVDIGQEHTLGEDDQVAVIPPVSSG